LDRDDLETGLYIRNTLGRNMAKKKGKGETLFPCRERASVQPCLQKKAAFLRSQEKNELGDSVTLKEMETKSYKGSCRYFQKKSKGGVQSTGVTKLKKIPMILLRKKTVEKAKKKTWEGG